MWNRRELRVDDGASGSVHTLALGAVTKVGIGGNSFEVGSRYKRGITGVTTRGGREERVQVHKAE